MYKEPLDTHLIFPCASYWELNPTAGVKFALVCHILVIWAKSKLLRIFHIQIFQETLNDFITLTFANNMLFLVGRPSHSWTCLSHRERGNSRSWWLRFLISNAIFKTYNSIAIFIDNVLFCTYRKGKHWVRFIVISDTSQ